MGYYFSERERKAARERSARRRAKATPEEREHTRQVNAQWRADNREHIRARDRAYVRRIRGAQVEEVDTSVSSKVR